MPALTREQIFACQTEDDWDEEGATGITAVACAAALEFLEDVLKRDAQIPLPRFSPSVFGAVTFQWRNEDEHLIVRVFPDSDLVFCHSEKIGVFRHISSEPRSAALQRVFNLFHPHAPHN